MRKNHLSIFAVSASLNAGNDIAIITKKTVIPIQKNKNLILESILVFRKNVIFTCEYEKYSHPDKTSRRY